MPEIVRAYRRAGLLATEITANFWVNGIGPAIVSVTPRVTETGVPMVRMTLAVNGAPRQSIDLLRTATDTDDTAGTRRRER